jgi:hypothetical protein
MSLDLIMWAPNRSTFVTFAENNNLASRDAENNLVVRKGVEWSWWGGTGQLMRTPRQLRATRAVNLSQSGEFAFNVGATPPSWLDDTVRAFDGDTEVGVYDRIQGLFAVFTGTATVGQSLDVYSGPTFVSGEVLLMRIHGSFFNSDRFTGDTDDEGQTIPESERSESWGKSRIARYVRKNGTEGTTEGIQHFEIDGVRIFRAADVLSLVASWGVPGHEWLGGNSF